MRQSFDGLSQLVPDRVAQDPLSGHFDVSRDRRRDRIKALCWDRDGPAPWYERPEGGTSRFPEARDGRVEVTPAAMAAILEGIDLSHARRQARSCPPALQPARNHRPFIMFDRRFVVTSAASARTGGVTTFDADGPLPDDIESAHRLFRGLLATPASRPTSTNHASTGPNNSAAASTAGSPRSSTPTGSRPSRERSSRPASRGLARAEALA
jgi:transposase